VEHEVGGGSATLASVQAMMPMARASVSTSMCPTCRSPWTRVECSGQKLSSASHARQRPTGDAKLAVDGVDIGLDLGPDLFRIENGQARVACRVVADRMERRDRSAERAGEGCGMSIEGPAPLAGLSIECHPRYAR